MHLFFRQPLALFAERYVINGSFYFMNLKRGFLIIPEGNAGMIRNRIKDFVRR